MLLGKDEIMELVDEGWLVQGMLDPEVQVQPAGIDLTLAKIFRLEGEGAIDFSNAKRKLPEYVEIEPDEDDCWKLDKGTYNGTMNEYIKLPNDVAAIVLPRSSALVCGIEAHSALWDPGYEGRGFLHFTITRPVRIYRNARIVQMIFFRVSSETEGYDGVFKGEDLLKKSRRGRE